MWILRKHMKIKSWKQYVISSVWIRNRVIIIIYNYCAPHFVVTLIDIEYNPSLNDLEMSFICTRSGWKHFLPIWYEEKPFRTQRVNMASVVNRPNDSSVSECDFSFSISVEDS